jgi:hypothetical protein
MAKGYRYITTGQCTITGQDLGIRGLQTLKASPSREPP